ncbi:hypothetical protein BDD12DRAFT_840101 [Trichophaea hybrida]|nr:hypothetical protein BDD12DRAFT_840101 [Trichophaea hybrida]
MLNIIYSCQPPFHTIESPPPSHSSRNTTSSPPRLWIHKYTFYAFFRRSTQPPRQSVTSRREVELEMDDDRRKGRMAIIWK